MADGGKVFKRTDKHVVGKGDESMEGVVRGDR